MKASEGQIPRWFQYGFFALSAAFLYLNLFVLPATPIAGTDLDQTLYLHNAARMFDGQMIYRDFFQFTPPGTELLYLGLFKIFGIRAWIPNAAMLAVGLCLTWLCITISRRILAAYRSYLPALLFLAVSFEPAIDGSHHWFSMLAAMAALALLIPEITPARLAGAGMLCGLASFFTQPRGLGALLGIAVFLVWEFRKRPQARFSIWKMEAMLAATFLATTAALNAYFVYEAGLRRFWWCTVTFGLKYYPAESSLNSFHAYLSNPPSAAHLSHVPEPGWLFIHALLPLAYVAFFALGWFKRPKRIGRAAGPAHAGKPGGIRALSRHCPRADYLAVARGGAPRADCFRLVSGIAAKACGSGARCDLGGSRNHDDYRRVESSDAVARHSRHAHRPRGFFRAG